MEHFDKGYFLFPYRHQMRLFLPTQRLYFLFHHSTPLFIYFIWQKLFMIFTQTELFLYFSPGSLCFYFSLDKLYFFVSHQSAHIWFFSMENIFFHFNPENDCNLFNFWFFFINRYSCFRSLTDYWQQLIPYFFPDHHCFSPINRVFFLKSPVFLFLPAAILSFVFRQLHFEVTSKPQMFFLFSPDNCIYSLPPDYPCFLFLLRENNTN